MYNICTNLDYSPRWFHIKFRNERRILQEVRWYLCSLRRTRDTACSIHLHKGHNTYEVFNARNGRSKLSQIHTQYANVLFQRIPFSSAITNTNKKRVIEINHIHTKGEGLGLGVKVWRREVKYRLIWSKATANKFFFFRWITFLTRVNQKWNQKLGNNFRSVGIRYICP